MDPSSATEEGARRFAARYELVAPALCAWAMQKVSSSVRSRIEVDDVLQETWLRAVRLADRFEGDDHAYRAWVFAIAKNLLLEVQRSARRLRRVHITDGDTAALSSLDEIAASVTALSQRLVRDENIRRFCDHVRTLPSEDQDLVAYCGLEGSTAADAGRKLGIGTEAAHKRWQRLRSRLRDDGVAADWLCA